MPAIQLSTEELGDATTAARAAEWRARQEAAGQQDPRARAVLLSRAERYARLVRALEKAARENRIPER